MGQDTVESAKPVRGGILRAFGRAASWGAWGIAGLFLLVSFSFGYALSTDAVRHYEAFDEAVSRWQSNADFRQICREYSILSNRALTSPFLYGWKPSDAVMFLRSLPGLPPHLRVNPGSRHHYDEFDRGALSAYLHLCSEQGVETFLDSFESLGRGEGPTDERILAFMRGFGMRKPVRVDAVAVENVRRMVLEVAADRPLSVRTRVGARLSPSIGSIARRLGVPADPHEMTLAQQEEVFVLLDDEVKAQDYELWRAKQFSDFLGGIWAQSYGRQYQDVIGPVVVLHKVGRVAFPVLLAVIVWRAVVAWRARHGAGERQPVASGGVPVEES